MVRFYEVKGADLDAEVREITDGQDELSYLMRVNSQFIITQLFLAVQAFYIALAFPITYPSAFDEKLIKNVIASKNVPVDRHSCKVQLPESAYV